MRANTIFRASSVATVVLDGGIDIDICDGGTEIDTVRRCETSIDVP